MRDFKGMKRQRGRNRGGGGGQGGGGKPQHNINRAFDSQGPDNIKVRGNAQHVYERYQALARDATSAGDRVLAENHQQHAEHYFRTLRAIQPNRAASEIVSRDTFGGGSVHDIDFEDEAVETAMEEADAQAAARAAEVQNQPQAVPAEGEGAPAGEAPRFDQGQGQRREWRDRPERGDRQPGEFRDRGFNDRPDRPQGEFRGDRQNQDRQNPQNQDRQGQDRQNQHQDRQAQDRQGQDRQGQERQAQDRQGGEVRDRGDRPRFRDRPERSGPDRPADDRPRDRPERDARAEGGDRPPREDRAFEPRRERFRDRPERAAEGARADGREPELALAAVADAPEPPRAEAVRPEPEAVLRSEDGGVSRLPGFLQAPAAPPTAAAAPAAEEGERPRRPRRRRTREDGDAAAPAPEVEEA